MVGKEKEVAKAIERRHDTGYSAWTVVRKTAEMLRELDKPSREQVILELLKEFMSDLPCFDCGKKLADDYEVDDGDTVHFVMAIEEFQGSTYAEWLPLCEECRSAYECQDD